MQQCVHDELAEPKRRTLIPNFFQIEKSILAADGFNCNISGSGPSIFSFCETLPQAETISSIMQSGFLEVGLQSETYISPLLAKGAHVISYE
jgi:homoserine kinase